MDICVAAVQGHAGRLRVLKAGTACVRAEDQGAGAGVDGRERPVMASACYRW